MHYAQPAKLTVPLQQLAQIVQGDVLAQCSVFGKPSEIPIAELHDHVDVLSFLDDLEEFDGVFVVELGHNSDLVGDDGGDLSALGGAVGDPHLFDGEGRVLIDLSETTGRNDAAQFVLPSCNCLWHAC